MLDEKEVVALQKKWNDDRYKIIDELNSCVLTELSNNPIDVERLNKVAAARVMFFNEFLTLCSIAGTQTVDRNDVRNAYVFARGEGGNT